MNEDKARRLEGLHRRASNYIGPIRGGGLAMAQAKAKANLAEQRLREAIDALPEGIVFLDPEARYILWNKRYAEIYHTTSHLFRVGEKLEDTLRIGVAKGFYPDAVGREEAWLAERLARLGQPGERMEQRLADGRWILIEERRTSDGGTIGIRVDITHLKLAEAEAQAARDKAEAASRAKSAFLANMSHEVRTPLNGILGLSQVLLRTGLDAEQRELLDSIVSSAASLNRVLSDVLDLSRAETGCIDVRSEPFDLGALLRDLSNFFGSQARDKGVRFSTETTPDLDRWVAGDRDRIHQVLSNLLGNALKFTASGEVRLTARSVERFGRPLCRFEVRDTGIGFDPAEAERLFGRFEQADASITRAHGGSGLGLAICRELVELMGGTIVAASMPGEGSTFSLDLPLPPAEAPAAAAAPEPVAGQLGRAPRILVAEDNAINRKVIDLALKGLGEVVVDLVENGRQAVDQAGACAYDLVVMDMQMPVMDGLTATRAIRAREALLGEARTPLIMLSANVMADHVEASREAGADLHLGKPFDIADLLGAVGSLLSDAADARAQAA